ncbi:MAG TPA: SPOR domain-containing protein [Patescibacteria group bacterium]|nr:SPOR domain-containing protein [Patescibacteria group bacterium]
MTDMTPQPQDEENIGSFYMNRQRTIPEPRRMFPKGLLTAFTVFAFAAIIWYAYPRGQEKYAGIDIPTIAAETAAYKFKPENPGGMEVPHQDSTVFDPIENRDTDTARVERLGAPPEEPVDKDEVIGAAPAERRIEKLTTEPEVAPVTENTEKVIAPVKDEPVKAAEKPAPSKTETAENKPIKIETLKTETAKATAKTAPAKGSIYIQLGAYRDLAAAKADWGKLQRKYPQTLGKLTMRTQKAQTATGTLNRLQAAAPSEARAGEICKALKAAGTGCIVVH